MCMWRCIFLFKFEIAVVFLICYKISNSFYFCVCVSSTGPLIPWYIQINLNELETTVIFTQRERKKKRQIWHNFFGFGQIDINLNLRYSTISFHLFCTFKYLYIFFSQRRWQKLLLYQHKMRIFEWKCLSEIPYVFIIKIKYVFFSHICLWCWHGRQKLHYGRHWSMIQYLDWDQEKQNILIKLSHGISCRSICSIKKHHHTKDCCTAYYENGIYHLKLIKWL